MATIKDVAKKSGVSVATVSRAINKSGYVSKETLNKVNTAVDELNYKPNETARSLYNKKSKMIGLLLPDISNPFFTLVARGVEDAALENCFHIIIGNGDRDIHKELKYIETFRLNNCAGFISYSLQIDDANEYAEQMNMHYVTLDSSNEFDASVEADHFKGGELQAQCLIDSGCSKILVMTSNQKYSSFAKRLKGAEKILSSNNIAFDVRSLGGDDVNEKLLDTIMSEKYDGIICYNDLLAIQVMGLLQNNGIAIPKDIQVIGYDDIQMSENYFPGLTTIKQPAYELGKIACEKLLHILKGQKVTNYTVLDVELIKRKSTRSDIG